MDKERQKAKDPKQYDDKMAEYFDIFLTVNGAATITSLIWLGMILCRVSKTVTTSHAGKAFAI